MTAADGVPTWLAYHDRYQTIICRRCQIGVRHPGLASHLQTQHRELPSGERHRIVQAFQAYPLIPSDAFVVPREPIPPFPGIRWYSDGLQCAQPGCTYIVRHPTRIRAHHRLHHQSSYPSGLRRSRGRPRKELQTAQALWRSNVPCQRLFPSGSGSLYFRVHPLAGDSDPVVTSGRGQPDLHAQLLHQLHAGEPAHPPDPVIESGTATEANPWLQRTGWVQHLHGHKMAELARLVGMPHRDEPILQAFELSMDRIIERARTSVMQQKINIFDRTALNMFNEHQVKAGQPFQDQLQNGTYMRYKVVWKKLLCFVYRIDQARRSGCYNDLPYRLTSPQRVSLQRSVRAAQNVIKDDLAENNTAATPCPILDKQILRFSMTLIDHQLRGDIYESFLVGFLAVLGINQENVCKTWGACVPKTNAVPG